MSLYHLGRQEFGDPADAGKLPTRQEAEQLLLEWVPNPKLRLHMRQVATLLREWAKEKNYPEDEQWLWECAGLLHDADWDRWPEEHCRRIVEHLEAHHYDPRLIRAIASHGPRHFGVEPRSELDNMIYLFDELSGFVHAASLVRPTGYEGMEPSSVKKKLKDKAFAAQVDRGDIEDAFTRTGLDFAATVAFIIRHQSGVSDT